MSALLPFEIDASGKGLLGMSAERFLRDYWQKRPLLIRNAFPAFVSPLQPEDLAGLACEEGVLARIVQHDWQNDTWQLENGPFAEEKFPAMPHKDWTLLVQDVDKWDADIRQLMTAFDFLPRWRIDDVMISFAATGGSVGAHIDQYDVFLLQAQGQRRWQIDSRPNPDIRFRSDAQIKLLQHFYPNHDWVLNPGDMLYLPPGVPHHGVAENPCLTFSLGMRAPSSAELLSDFVDDLCENADESVRYQDPDLLPASDPYQIDTAALQRVQVALQRLQMADSAQLADWFGRFMTLYRSVDGRDLPQHNARCAELADALQQHAQSLHRDAWSRIAYWQQNPTDALLFVAGQSFPLPLADAKLLAAQESIDASHWKALSDTGRTVLTTLFNQGRYAIDSNEDEADTEDSDG